jgi:hypothetical protein
LLYSPQDTGHVNQVIFSFTAHFSCLEIRNVSSNPNNKQDVCTAAAQLQIASTYLINHNMQPLHPNLKLNNTAAIRNTMMILTTTKTRSTMTKASQLGKAESHSR